MPFLSDVGDGLARPATQRRNLQVLLDSDPSLWYNYFDTQTEPCVFRVWFRFDQPFFVQGGQQSEEGGDIGFGFPDGDRCMRMFQQ